MDASIIIVPFAGGAFGVLGFNLLFNPKTLAERLGALILGIMLGLTISLLAALQPS